MLQKLDKEQLVKLKTNKIKERRMEIGCQLTFDLSFDYRVNTIGIFVESVFKEKIGWRCVCRDGTFICINETVKLTLPAVLNP